MVLVVLVVVLVVVAWIQHRRGKIQFQPWAVLIVVAFSALTFSALFATQQQRTGFPDYGPAWIGLGIAVATLIPGLVLVYRDTRNSGSSRSSSDR